MPIRAIEALDPAHRHAQTPVVLDPNHQVYEWWYFEVEFEDKDGKPWRVITSFHYPHGMDSHRLLAHQRYRAKGVDYFTKYGDHPAHYAGIASYIVDVNATKNVALLVSRFPRADIPARVTVSRPGAARVNLVFGDSSFIENPDGSFTLRVKQRGLFFRPARKRDLKLDLQVTFTQNTPGFQPHDAVLIEQTGVRHHWACVLPNPTVMIDHVLVERERPGGNFHTLCRAKSHVAGHGGYHDHQWGDDLFYKQIHEWHWGRVPTGGRGTLRPRDKVLFFDVAGVSSPGVPAAKPAPVLVELPGDGSAPVALTPAPGAAPFSAFGAEHMNFADGCQLGVQGQNVPYQRWVYLRARNGAAKREFNIEHLRSTNVDVWPFYLRFAPGVYDYNSGRTFWSISELMRADRMPLDGSQKVLALADKITVDA